MIISANILRNSTMQRIAGLLVKLELPSRYSESDRLILAKDLHRMLTCIRQGATLEEFDIDTIKDCEAMIDRGLRIRQYPPTQSQGAPCPP